MGHGRLETRKAQDSEKTVPEEEVPEQLGLAVRTAFLPCDLYRSDLSVLFGTLYEVQGYRVRVDGTDMFRSREGRGRERERKKKKKKKTQTNARSRAVFGLMRICSHMHAQSCEAVNVLRALTTTMI